MAQTYERHENQMKGCTAELKVSDWQMIALQVSIIFEIDKSTQIIDYNRLITSVSKNLSSTALKSSFLDLAFP